MKRQWRKQKRVDKKEREGEKQGLRKGKKMNDSIALHHLGLPTAGGSMTVMEADGDRTAGAAAAHPLRR